MKAKAWYGAKLIGDNGEILAVVPNGDELDFVKWTVCNQEGVYDHFAVVRYGDKVGRIAQKQIGETPSKGIFNVLVSTAWLNSVCYIIEPQYLGPGLRGRYVYCSPLYGFKVKGILDQALESVWWQQKTVTVQAKADTEFPPEAQAVWGPEDRFAF